MAVHSELPRAVLVLPGGSAGNFVRLQRQRHAVRVLLTHPLEFFPGIGSSNAPFKLEPPSIRRQSPLLLV
jgi:hypothetical protein